MSLNGRGERSQRELSGALFHFFRGQQELFLERRFQIDHFAASRLGALYTISVLSNGTLRRHVPGDHCRGTEVEHRPLVAHLWEALAAGALRMSNSLSGDEFFQIMVPFLGSMISTLCCLSFLTLVVHR